MFHQGRARVGRVAVRWQGRSRAFKPHAACLRSDPCLQVWVRPASATTLWADAHKEDQRRQRTAAQLNRVRSARYKLDLAFKAKKMSIHVVFLKARERPGEICGLGRWFFYDVH
jgi:hypothetical protein